MWGLAPLGVGLRLLGLNPRIVPGSGTFPSVAIWLFDVVGSVIIGPHVGWDGKRRAGHAYVKPAFIGVDKDLCDTPGQKLTFCSDPLLANGLRGTIHPLGSLRFY